MAPNSPTPTPAKPEDAGRPEAVARPRRRWRRRVLWTMATLVVLAAAALFVVTRPFVLTPLVSRQLSGALGADVSVEKAVWHWRGGLELHGLAIDLASDAAAVGGSHEEYARLLEVQRLDVGLSPARLLAGNLDLRHIEIEAPVLRIVEDPETGGVNLRQWLLRPQDRASGGGPTVTLPKQVRIANGRIAIETLQDGVLAPRASMQIDGTLSPDADGSGQTLLLEQIGDLPEGQTPLRITGRITSSPASITLEVADFDLAQPIGVLASPQLRGLWTELDPDGALPTLRARFADDGAGNLRLGHAELVLKGLAVTVPVESLGLTEELEAPATMDRPTTDDDGLATASETEPTKTKAPYAIRMTEVDGRFVVEDSTLSVEGLTGMIEGLRYHVNGRAQLSRKGALQLEVRTDAYELPESPPFILRLPAAARQIYGEYQPRGTFRTSVHIERQPGQPVTYVGQADLIDVRAAFHKFTYPIRGLNGRVLFDERGLAFRGLAARGPNGGRITFEGVVTDPGPEALADVTIRMERLPIDEHLMGALNEQARGAIGMFLHRPSFDRLVQRGLIGAARTDENTKPLGEAALDTQADAPFVFSLDNRVNGQVRIVRDLTLGPEAIVATTVEGKGLNVLFEHFGYPMTLDGGQLVIRDTHIDVDALALRGPGGMSATVNGDLTRRPGEAFVPDLRVTAFKSPVNRYLLAALPSAAEETLRDLSVRGDVSAEVRVTGDDDGQPRWRLTGELRRGHAQPYDGKFALDAITARFDIDGQRARINALTGRHGPAVIDLSAEIPYGPIAQGANHIPDVRIDATATNLPVSASLLDLLPPDTEVRGQLAALFERFDPGGRTQARLSLAWPSVVEHAETPKANQSAAADGGVRIDLELEPKELALTHQGQRVTASEMTGRVFAAADHIRLEALRGALADGWAQADGVIGLHGASDTALTLSGALPVDAPLLKAALPENINAAVEGLSLRGPVTLEDARLLHRVAPAGRPAIEFDAAFKFDGNTAQLGVPITDLKGTLDTAVRAYEGDRPTELRLALNAQRVRAAERLIAPLQASLTNVEHPGWLAVERVTGRVYGGTVTATGGLPLDGRGNYQLELSLQEAALGPFLDPPDDAPAAAVPSDPAPNAATMPAPGAVVRSLDSGVVSANLALEADMADASTRRGRGAVLVRNAQLFQKQGGIGLLRVLNFAAPSSQGLDSADARFLIDRDLVRFDHLEVTGPGLELRGTGTMTYPDTELDLTFFTRNKNAPQLGPLSDFLNAIKDELVSIRVTGTLADPRAGVAPLSGARNASEKLLQAPAP